MSTQKETKTETKRQRDKEREIQIIDHQKNGAQHLMTNDTTTIQPDKKLFLDSI